jgi:xylulokinase
VLGAAIIAGVGCGAFPSLEAGSAQMVNPERLFEPQERTRRGYADHYQRYLELSAGWREWAGQG